MTNTFDQMRAIVEHARAWGIDDDGISRVSFHGPAPMLRLKDYETDLFQRWARHLLIPLLSVGVGGTSLVATGQLMCGHRITVSVRVPAHELKALGMYGVLTLGQVSQIVLAEAKAVGA